MDNIKCYQISVNRDNGKHTRTFYHGERRLPELVLGTGFSYFSSFCTRVRRHYNDNVHYAFSSAYTVIEPETPETPAVLSPIKEYALGSPLVFSKMEKGIWTQ